VSYREEDGKVVLTMSREDWTHVLITFSYAAGAMGSAGDENSRHHLFLLLDRLNSGNPNYTPYRVDTRNGLPLIPDND
jgi:hypothetical protein